MIWLVLATVVSGITRRFDAGCFFLSLILVVAARRRSKACLLLAGLSVVGALWSHVRVERVRADQRRFQEAFFAGGIELSGRVCDFPATSRWGVSFPFATRVDGRPLRILLRTRRFSIDYGDSLYVLARSVKSRSDRSEFLLAQGLAGIARAVRINRTTGEQSVRGAFWKVHRYARTELSRTLGTAAAVPAALLIGEKAAISEADRNAFRRLGISHLLALSGMHLAILVAITSLLGLMSARVRQTGSFFAATTYVATAGAIPSLQRAYVMFAFLVAARVLQRPVDLGGTLVRAALLMILARPYSLYSVGLQLSFAAMAAVAIALKIMPARNAAGLARITRFGIYVGSGLGVSTVVQLLVLPIQLHYFGETSVVGPLATVLGIPLVATLLTATAGFVSLSAVTAFDHATAAFGWLVGVSGRLVAAGAHFAPETVSPGLPDPLLFYAGAAVLLFFRKRLIALGAGGALIAMSFLT